MSISCKSITGKGCNFSPDVKDLEKIIFAMLHHINKIHDPNFVPRCQDDLYIEYKEFVDIMKNYHNLSH